VALAESHPAVSVQPDPEGGLIVTGPQSDVSAYVAELVLAGMELLEFRSTETPLEALFFMLTGSAPAPEPVRVPA
jgi:ABC-2 type transport system ATP-binding protein